MPQPLPPEALTLPARYYTDPGYFETELERFFCGRWICAGRLSQIPEGGSYFLREVGSESLLIVRDTEGEVSALFNVCRHRGSRLCGSSEGRLEGGLRCPYHGWSYDLRGRLVGAPHMEDVRDFRREDFPLRRAAIAFWDGHIFVHLGEAPESLDSQLGELRQKFQPWGMEELRLGARISYTVQANWKLIIQNYSECLHCPIIHPAFQKLSHYMSGENEPPTRHTLGGRMELREGVESVTRDGRRRRAPLPGLPAEEQRRVHYYAVLPNLLLSLHPDYMMTHTLWPEACDRTRILCEWHFHPREMARDDFDPQDAVEIWDLTNRQDWQASERTQLGLKSRAYQPGPYSSREELLYAFDRIILEDAP